jgi:hypothetical protein
MINFRRAAIKKNVMLNSYRDRLFIIKQRSSEFIEKALNVASRNRSGFLTIPKKKHS